jgi:hypothetical protein
MNSRKQAAPLYALSVLGVAALLIYQYLVNRGLRSQLATEKEKVHQLESSQKALRVSHSAVKPPETRLPRTEIESKLLEVIHQGLWRKDRQAHMAIFRMIESKDMAYAFEIVDRNAMGQTRRLVRMDLLTAWAKADPEAAAAWLGSFPSNEAQRTEKGIIGDVWSEKDPRAALAFAGPTPGIFRNFALLAPNEAATAALTAFADGSDRGAAIETVARTWFDSDPSAALKWALALPDEKARLFGVRPLLNQLAAVDPASVAPYVATLPSSQGFLQVEQSFARQWSESDPSAAAAWATNLPSTSGMRLTSMMEISREWAEDDPKGAGAWIESLPQGADRDSVTLNFVNGSLTYDPAIAAQYAITIVNENQRSNAIAAVALRWLNADPAAAQSWLSQITVPEQARQLIKTGFPTVGGGLQQ